jgi:MFS family permease
MSTTTKSKPTVGTFTALRNTNFRLYTIGQLVSVTGAWMQGTAQGYLVFQLAQSEAWLGLVACAAGFGVWMLAPFSGSIVDRMSHRKLIYTTQITQMLLAFALFGLTATGLVQVWHVAILAFILGITNAVDFPARQAFLMDISSKETISSAIAMNSIMNNFPRIIGPVIAGVLLVNVGAALCFLINGLSYIAVLISLWMMELHHDTPRISQSDKKTSALADLREGLNFAMSRRGLAIPLIMSFISSTFFIPLLQMLPSFATEVLNSPKEGYSLLQVSQGVGAVLCALSVSWLSTKMTHNRIMWASMFMSSLLMFLFAIQTELPIAVVSLGTMWFFIIIGFICMNTLLQTRVPSEYRARVLALYTLSFTGVTPFSALLLGFFADEVGTPSALIVYAVLGLLACVWLLYWVRTHKEQALPVSSILP